METSEHIVESYVRYIKNWFTISNIKCRKGKEIDLLAIDPQSNKRYHIEVSVSVVEHFKKLTSNIFKKGEKDPATIKTTLTFFEENKYNDVAICEKLKEYGFEDNYEKIIVTYDIEKSPHMDNQLKKYNITIWKIHDIIQEISEKIDEKYYSDEILRIIQLTSKMK